MPTHEPLANWLVRGHSVKLASYTVSVDWYPNTWHLKSGGITYKGTVTTKNSFNLEIEHDYHLQYDSNAALVYLSTGDEVFVNETQTERAYDRESAAEPQMSAYELGQARKREEYLKAKEDRERRAGR